MAFYTILKAINNQTLALNAVVQSISTIKQIDAETTQNIAINAIDIYLEPNSAAAAGSILARYWQTGEDPTLTEGIPVRAFDKISFNSIFDIANFRIKAVDGLAHTLQIQQYTL